jgi:hypothetical protein
MIMIKIDLRQKIAATKYLGHLMLPSLMSVIGGAEGEVDQYVSEYFSVAKFRLHML